MPGIIARRPLKTPQDLSKASDESCAVAPTFVTIPIVIAIAPTLGAAMRRTAPPRTSDFAVRAMSSQHLRNMGELSLPSQISRFPRCETTLQQAFVIGVDLLSFRVGVKPCRRPFESDV